VTEAQYQQRLVKKLKLMFPGCLIMKNDAGLVQGILDLTILYGNTWAMLEVKASPDAPFQPNQEYYLRELGEMSFAAVIYPENEAEVLVALQEAFSSRGRSCISQS
jgi:hypothetical protein